MYLEEILTVFSRMRMRKYWCAKRRISEKMCMRIFSESEKMRLRIPPIGYGNTIVFSDKNDVYNANLYIRLFAFLGDKTKVYFQVNDKTKLYFR